MHIDAIEADRLAKKKKKISPNDGFADYEQATERQYKRLVKNITPNMSAYEEQKHKLGPAFYGDRNSILQGLHEDKKEAIDKMVNDLHKQLVYSVLKLYYPEKTFKSSFFNFFKGLQNVINTVGVGCIMTMLILITSMKETPNSMKN